MGLRVSGIMWDLLFPADPTSTQQFSEEYVQQAAARLAGLTADGFQGSGSSGSGPVQEHARPSFNGECVSPESASATSSSTLRPSSRSGGGVGMSVDTMEDCDVSDEGPSLVVLRFRVVESARTSAPGAAFPVVTAAVSDDEVLQYLCPTAARSAMAPAVSLQQSKILAHCFIAASESGLFSAGGGRGCSWAVPPPPRIMVAYDIHGLVLDISAREIRHVTTFHAFSELFLPPLLPPFRLNCLHFV